MANFLEGAGPAISGLVPSEIEIRGQPLRRLAMDYQGAAIVLTPRNESGSAPWYTVDDVTFRYNWIRRVFSVLVMSGRDARPSHVTARIAVEHNIAESLFDRGPSNPRTILLPASPDDVAIAPNASRCDRSRAKEAP